MTQVAARRVRRSAWLGYPTRLEACARPDLLARHQPPAWLSNRELAAAAGVFLAANVGGCGKPAPQASSKTAPVADAPAIVAPIFKHGDGRGATGCVVLSPPVFLSEEEAFDVISGELRSHGVQVTERERVLAGVQVPQRAQMYFDKGTMRVEARPDADVFRTDGFDPKLGIAVEFASRQDYHEIDGPWVKSGYSSVTDYDFQSAAQFIGERVKDANAVQYFGAFYDPAINVGDVRKWAGMPTAESAADALGWSDSNERLDATREESKRLLREQVRDFVDWLKAQGAI